MTHGVGTLSSHHCGGGGHHSTFHVTHMPHTHVHMGTSRQSRSTASTDTDSECSCALCHLVAFLLCIKQMKWQTRIVLTWVYLIAISLTVGLLVIFRHYSQQTISSSPTDMRELDRISTLFCDTVDVDSTSVINTYALASDPSMKADETVVYITKKTTSIQLDKYEYWGFYLLAGSTAEVTICSNDMLRMYIIKGRDNLDRWMDDMDCCSEVDHAISLCYIHVYGISNIPTVINYTATHSDDYYFVFANNINNWPRMAYIYVSFHLVRTVYDVSAATKTCEATSCSIDLTFSTDDNIVIDVPRNSALDVDVTVTCNPRVQFYLLILLLIPLSVGLALSFAIYRWSKRAEANSERADTRISTASNRVALHAVENGTQSRDTDGPPSYQDAIPPIYQDAIPPSYQDAIPPSYQDAIPPSYQDAISGRPKYETIP